MYTHTIVVLLFPITVVQSIVHRPPQHGPLADPNHNVFDHAVDHVNNPLFDYHDGTDSSNSDGGSDTPDQSEVPNDGEGTTPTQQQGSLRGRGLVSMYDHSRVEELAPQAALEPASAPVVIDESIKAAPAPIISAPPEIKCVNARLHETNPYAIHPSLSISKDSIDMPPYIVAAIACGTILSMGTNYGKTTTESTWVTNDKSMGTNYGNRIIWEDEADDFRSTPGITGSIYKKEGKKKPGEPDIDILIDSDGSLFDQDNADDYDIVAKSIWEWEEEKGIWEWEEETFVKLIWGEESGDFIIEVGGKVTYLVNYDAKEKKGVIVKK